MPWSKRGESWFPLAAMALLVSVRLWPSMFGGQSEIPRHDSCGRPSCRARTPGRSLPRPT